MPSNKQDPANNVLFNEQAMAILQEARDKLRELGLHCGLGPDSMFPESDMSAVLRVSTSEQALDETIVGSLIAGEYANSPEGRKTFDAKLAEFRTDCVIGKAMSSRRPPGTR